MECTKIQKFDVSYRSQITIYRADNITEDWENLHSFLEYTIVEITGKYP